MIRFGSVNRAATFGAILRHPEWLTIRAFFHHLQHVRDHFSRALDQYRVTYLQPQPLDLIHIVECGTADSDAADLHRLKHRDRS